MTTSARESAARLSGLLRSEHFALGDFIAALAVFDRQRHWIDLGYPSLFAFLQRELRLSDGAAFYRQTAARLAQKFPEIVDGLRSGDLCLTTVVELSKVLTVENASELLPRFAGLSKREAKEIVAEVKPEPAPERTVITALSPVVPPTADRDQAQLGQPSTCMPTPAPTTQEVRPPPPAPPPPTVFDPKNAELDRLYITVPRAFRKKLAAARDALSHSHPGASDGELLEIALDLVLEQAAKRRHLVKKPRKTPPPMAADSDAIPAHVARQVWLRDGGRCRFPTADGGVCGSTYQLELDHIRPKALGGPSTADNLRVACTPHNLHRARAIYGDDWMDQFTSNPRRPSVREPVAEYRAPFPWRARRALVTTAPCRSSARSSGSPGRTTSRCG